MNQKESPMPFVKIRGKVFFIKSDIEKWIQSHTHNAKERVDG
jgi:predicted DNA-binding transcriptional regulator AlpA